MEALYSYNIREYNKGMKQCSQCQQLKEETDFHKRTDNGRLASECKVCRKKYHNKHYESVRYLPNQRYKHLLSAAKSRSIDLTLTLKDYLEILKPTCSYCDGDITKESGSGLDRIDSAIGYHKDNVKACCSKCNFGKTDRFTSEEWKIMIDALKRWRS